MLVTSVRCRWSNDGRGAETDIPGEGEIITRTEGERERERERERKREREGERERERVRKTGGKRERNHGQAVTPRELCPVALGDHVPARIVTACPKKSMMPSACDCRSTILN